MEYLRILRNPYLNNAVWSYKVNDALFSFGRKRNIISKVYRSKEGKIQYIMNNFEETRLNIIALEQNKKQLLKEFANG